MNVSEAQARVKARIWQAIAQSKADFADIPQAQLNQLVEVATNAALLELDEGIEEMLEKEGVSEKPASHEGETVLWQGRPFLTISVSYVITDERVRILSGILGKDREDVELIRIQDMDQRQTLRERLMNVGDIIIRSHDPSDPQILLNNVRNPQEVHETLRRAVLEARERHNLRYREEM